MPYSINGLSLDSTSRGWRQLFETTVPGGAGISMEESNLTLAGRDGAIPIAPSEAAPSIAIRVGVSSYEAHVNLLTHLRSSALLTLGRGTATAAATLVSARFTYSGVAALDTENGVYGYVDIVVSIPGIYFREAEGIYAASGTTDIMTGLEGPVDDAVISFSGPCTNPMIYDNTSGTYIGYSGSVGSGEYVRFDARTGRAWKSGDAWSGGSEIPASSIQYGPGPYFVRITPRLLGNNRVAQVNAINGAAQIRARLTRRA